MSYNKLQTHVSQKARKEEEFDMNRKGMETRQHIKTKACQLFDDEGYLRFDRIKPWGTILPL